MNIAALQEELAPMSKKDAVLHLMERTGQSKSWCERNLQHIRTIDPKGFEQVGATNFIRRYVDGYADPTGNRATWLADQYKTAPEPSAKIRSEAA